MHTYTIIALLNNAALLMGLSVIYELSYYIPGRFKKLTPIIDGLLIGMIVLVIMTIPFELTSGIVFDTRSILLSVSALFFGAYPTIIASLFAIIYRLLMGGSGAFAGVSVIIASCAIGLYWRNYLLKKITFPIYINIYIFGVIIHIVMICCMFVMPFSVAVNVVKEISIPVLIIYPIGTVLLTLLLFRQKERNLALLRVAESEERYKSLFDNNHAVMLLFEHDDGHIIDANSAACTFYGWTLSELKSMNITQINTLSFDEINIEVKKAISENRNQFLFKHRRANKEPVDVEVYSGPINQDGKMLIYSIVHDISERMAALSELQESEKRFKLLVESSPDAIFIQTNELFSFLNPSAVRLFGAESAEQLLGTLVMDRFHPDYHEIIRKRIDMLGHEKISVSPNEEVFLQIDGTPVIVDVTSVPIRYNQMDGALVFARDISERKKMEAAQNEMMSQLRQQQKLESIGTLAGGVAHEINNPINGIMNYAQLILDKLDKDSQSFEYAKEIIHETERISIIVKNLLQFSRQEKQSHSYASIYDIISQTISLISTLVKKDQIILDIQLDDNLPDIKCRSQQIQQVLMNLLTNARDTLNEKYREYDENKIIHVRCNQYTSEQRRWIKITVEDHGKGISTELYDKIFDPFFSTKPKDKGTGLGLSISFGIIKDHHGKISIDTKAGQGSKFIVDLPVDNGWTLN